MKILGKKHIGLDKEYKRHGSDSYWTTTGSALVALGLNEDKWIRATPEGKEKMLKEHFKDRYDAAEKHLVTLNNAGLKPDVYEEVRREIWSARNFDNDAGNVLRYEIKDEKDRIQIRDKHLKVLGINQEKWSLANVDDKQAILKGAAENQKTSPDRESAFKALGDEIRSEKHNEKHNEELKGKLKILGIDEKKWADSNSDERHILRNNAKPKNYDYMIDSPEAKAFDSLEDDCNRNNRTLNRPHLMNSEDNRDGHDPFTRQELTGEKASYSKELVSLERDMDDENVLPQLGCSGGADLGNFLLNSRNGGGSGGNWPTARVSAKNTASPSDDQVDEVTEAINKLFDQLFRSEHSTSVEDHSTNFVSEDGKDSLIVEFNPETAETTATLTTNKDADPKDVAELVTKSIELYADPNTSVITEVKASSQEMGETIINTAQDNGNLVSLNASVSVFGDEKNSILPTSEESSVLEYISNFSY